MSNGTLLVVQLRDSVTFDAPVDPALAVTVVGSTQQPLRKSGGFYAFPNLQPGTYQVQVQSNLYQQATLSVTIAPIADAWNMQVPVLVLTPSSQYPFPYGSTLLYAMIQSSDGAPAADVSGQAFVTSETCAKGRLGQSAEAGSQQLKLLRVAGLIRTGDQYCLLGTDGADDATPETCTVASFDSATQTCTLQTPLQGNYPRGACLLPMVTSRSDSRGQLVLAFGNYRNSTYQVRLAIATGGAGTVREVSITEGTTIRVGSITMTGSSN